MNFSILRITILFPLILLAILINYNTVQAETTRPLNFPDINTEKVYYDGQIQGRLDSVDKKSYNPNLPNDYKARFPFIDNKRKKYFTTIYTHGYKHGYFITQKGYAYFKEGYELGFELKHTNTLTKHPHYNKPSFLQGYEEGKEVKLDILSSICDTKDKTKITTQNACQKYWITRKNDAQKRGITDSVSLLKPINNHFFSNDLKKAYLSGFYKNKERKTTIRHAILDGLLSHEFYSSKELFPIKNYENNLYIHYFKVGIILRNVGYLLLIILSTFFYFNHKRKKALLFSTKY